MEREVPRILGSRGRKGEQLVLPAYDHVLKASHLFNIMDARGAIAVAERQSYIGRIPDLCKLCAEPYVAQQGGNAGGSNVRGRGRGSECAPGGGAGGARP